MFVEIETKGATHIFIAVPHEDAPSALPAIARMLEKNAVFIQKGWREMSVKKPVMTINLSDKVEIGDEGDVKVIVFTGEHTIGADFVALTPEVVASTEVMRKKLIDASAALTVQVNGLKAQLAAAEQELGELRGDK